LKKGDQNAYLEIAPHYPLSSFIHRAGRKSVIILRGGKRTDTIIPSDLTGVVQAQEVT
jgi:hypothetical protein